MAYLILYPMGPFKEAYIYIYKIIRCISRKEYLIGVCSLPSDYETKFRIYN